MGALRAKFDSGVFGPQYATIGKVITAGFIGLGAYIAIKNYKKDGFWSGVGAVMLLTSSIAISKQKTE